MLGVLRQKTPGAHPPPQDWRVELRGTQVAAITAYGVPRRLPGFRASEVISMRAITLCPVACLYPWGRLEEADEYLKEGMLR
jgi:hypothetical protein